MTIGINIVLAIIAPYKVVKSATAIAGPIAFGSAIFPSIATKPTKVPIIPIAGAISTQDWAQPIFFSCLICIAFNSLKTGKESANVEESKKPLEQKKIIYDQPKKNDFEKLNNAKLNSNKTDLKKKNVEVIEKKKSYISPANKIVLQFGAFSRKDYAQNQKKDIEQKIKNKFPEIKINVDYESDRKLYKLIYKAADKDLAKSICKFSEKNKD